ncbi:MAG: protein PilI [Gammaproteobacteria bacterium]|nr:MAG: protein PilI [Gammaproteobacteria bacterium]
MAAVSPLEQLRELESKALARKALVPAGQARAQEWRGVGFRVGHVELVAGMDTVVEALEPVKCTRVPAAKPWFEGIANVRGQLVPVSDFYAFLYGERLPRERGNRILLFRLANTVAGLLVTAVTGIRSFPIQAREDGDGGVAEALRPFVGGCFRRGGEVYPIFEFNRLVGNERFMQIVETRTRGPAATA